MEFGTLLRLVDLIDLMFFWSGQVNIQGGELCLGAFIFKKQQPKNN